jgi:hypothetical protein
MVRTAMKIHRKEFNNNLLSARFAIGYLRWLFLIPLSVLLFISDDRGQVGQDRGLRDRPLYIRHEGIQ